MARRATFVGNGTKVDLRDLAFAGLRPVITVKVAVLTGQRPANNACKSGDLHQLVCISIKKLAACD
ncbi:hypothetical protein J2Y45_002555 [Dyadobacter sp. BE34]|uniref:Uncharacterized protein n=1 Tax=Dyadobacter fermentans TaxID=94254 RepID=A0ABU1QVF2_9BACT|nr:hypothetical protein [Dyadobacter fermentans]MDR7043104.1 hypothetical protein [Dyadobacter sp. BE242]MDR7197416.1 hypothetical protein [Dyadobacter sp. BE34]MDR7215151.1 hypothetical protein [Dyadobacter sp. BE31]MDR7262686.1 hypothetical protein [Dyadobacter sp. BE32]